LRRRGERERLELRLRLALALALELRLRWRPRLWALLEGVLMGAESRGAGSVCALSDSPSELLYAIRPAALGINVSHTT
jgi:hypothetical protein